MTPGRATGAPGVSRRDGLRPRHVSGRPRTVKLLVRARGPALAPALRSEGRVRAANGQQTSENRFAQPCGVGPRNARKAA